MKLNIKNEYNKLKKVLLGPSIYKEEQNELEKILKKYNIEIFYTIKNDKCFLQMFTRDPFIVIDDKLLISNMKEDIRKEETNTINEILEIIDKEKIIYVPKDIYLEGGDIIIHNKYIFIGQEGNRTNIKGIDFLKETFPNYNIVPLKMINPDNNTNWIHLDCLFNPVSTDSAIIYKKGFTKDSLETINKLLSNLIDITKKEQSELAANVFSIGNKTIIMQKRHRRISNKLKALGFNIETINKYETIKETGFVRCLTCPLERD